MLSSAQRRVSPKSGSVSRARLCFHFNRNFHSLEFACTLGKCLKAPARCVVRRRYRPSAQFRLVAWRQFPSRGSIQVLSTLKTYTPELGVTEARDPMVFHTDRWSGRCTLLFPPRALRDTLLSNCNKHSRVCYLAARFRNLRCTRGVMPIRKFHLSLCRSFNDTIFSYAILIYGDFFEYTGRVSYIYGYVDVGSLSG